VKPRFALDENDVKAALEAAQREAARNAWLVSIAVVDDGGHLLGFLRLGNATPLSASVALEKARTAAMSRRESKFYDESVKGGRLAYLSVAGIVPLEGGVPVIVGGECIGAVGVSGVRSAQDAQIAAAAVNAILAGA
jgi:glc operon protein GlcG